MSGIKICGLFRECDIGYVNEAEPDHAGFIIDFPKSRRNVDPEKASKLRRMLKDGIKAVGVFVDKPAEEVVSVSDMIGLDIIQLHGHEDESYIASLRKRTERPVWKAFRVKTIADLDEAAKCSADEVLLDNGYGTGIPFDWTLLKGFPRPFILAGGLTPQTIPDALMRLSPKIVDISSGVETEGFKDREKILAAVRAVRGSGL